MTRFLEFGLLSLLSLGTVGGVESPESPGAGCEDYGGVRAGDRPEYTFGAELVNGPGVVSLDDLRGRPVLFDFWGKQCYACVGGSVPHSLQLASEYADELVVILVECQGASAAEAEAYAFENRWLGAPALWTCEMPFRPGGKGLPRFVLLSSEGEVLMTGNPIAMRSRIDDAIEEEVQRVRRGPDGTPRALQRAWAQFADGKIAQAFSEARKAQGGRYGDHATVALASFGERLDRDLVRIERMIKGGYLAQAEERLTALARGVRGDGELEARVRRLQGKLRGPERSGLLAADRELNDLIRTARSKGLTARVLRDLERFAERHRGTASGRRAQHLLSLSRR